MPPSEPADRPGRSARPIFVLVRQSTLCTTGALRYNLTCESAPGGPTPAANARGNPWHSRATAPTRGPKPPPPSPWPASPTRASSISSWTSSAASCDRNADYVDVLRAHGNNLTLKGRYAEGLEIDKRLVQLRPTDPLAHYNLACSYALLEEARPGPQDAAPAVELGYRDFRYMREDRDLDSIRHDPRFRQLLREYENR